MASITRACRSVLEFLRQSCAGLALLLAMTVTPMTATAGAIEPVRAALAHMEDGSVALHAEFAIDLGNRLEEAVTRGVPLNFLLEFEISKPRWWWANETIVSRNSYYRLSYNALTQQYRLANGVLHYNVASLSEALRLLSRIQLIVADKGVLKAGESYAAGLRLSLDRSQLPKPFQIDALANRDWQLETRVLRWQHAVPQEPRS